MGTPEDVFGLLEAGLRERQQHVDEGPMSRPFKYTVLQSKI